MVSTEQLCADLLYHLVKMDRKDFMFDEPRSSRGRAPSPPYGKAELATLMNNLNITDGSYKRYDYNLTELSHASYVPYHFPTEFEYIPPPAQRDENNNHQHNRAYGPAPAHTQPKSLYYYERPRMERKASLPDVNPLDYSDSSETERDYMLSAPVVQSRPVHPHDALSAGVLHKPEFKWSDEERKHMKQASYIKRNYKTQLCKGLRNGYCTYGPDCTFAHTVEELRVRKRHPLYKTKLCATFEATGSCTYGGRCTFIHRRQDISTPLASGGIYDY